MAITEKMATAVANLHFLHIFKALIYSLKGNHLVFTGDSEGKLCALCTFLTWLSCYFNFQAGNQAILFYFCINCAVTKKAAENPCKSVYKNRNDNRKYG